MTALGERGILSMPQVALTQAQNSPSGGSDSTFREFLNQWGRKPP